MTTDTPTPLTDALSVVGYGESGIENSYGFRCVPIADAREIERELIRTQAALSAAEQRAEVMGKGLSAVSALIRDSHGVAGLHLNGDIAPWSELLTGGRFEEWLLDFDAAIASGAGESGNG